MRIEISLVFVYLFLFSVASIPCDYFQPFVTTTPLCNLTQDDFYLAVDPKPTPFGAIDVSQHGCRYIYPVRIDKQDRCCGIYPRWNWILGSCDPNMPPNPPGSAFACTADVQNTSHHDIYYIAAYQWNGAVWTLDTTSSISGNGGLVDTNPIWAKFKISGRDSPYPPGGDWQNKWAPRTVTTDTQGLGPPGFMFVLSAKRLQWMTFYSLMQKTINRGTEDQFAPNYGNCWYAELDFLESPFWSTNGKRDCPLTSHPYASFFSTGSQFGGCFPMGINMGDNFQNECLTEWCCEATSCAPGYKPYIDLNNYGKSVAGCTNSNVPPTGTTFIGPKNNPAQCANFRVLGGCSTNSFLDNDPSIEYMFAFVVDHKGIWTYRWIANTESQADAIWPGLRKYNSDPVLHVSRPQVRPGKTSPPCLSNDPFCVIFHPGSTGQRPCVSAIGNVNELDHMGVAAAAGKNWWDLFSDTNQWQNYDSSILATNYSPSK